MSTHKHIDRICIIVTVLALIVTVLFMSGESLGIEKIVDEDAERNSDSTYFTDNDLNGDWTGYSVTTITLNGDSAKVSGSGAYYSGDDLTITQSGYYEISGRLTDGSIIVDAKSFSKVWIRLNGVALTCSDSACLIVEQADKVFLTLADGTESAFSSGADYSAEAVENGINACIYTRDDLTINGSGSLSVSGFYKHGIKANDDLVITGGVITVTEAKDAIHVNDSFRITETDLILTAEDDAIDLDSSGEETDDEDTGYFYAESGTVTITSGGDGIHAAGDVTIDGGVLTIAAEDDGIHSDSAVVINGGSITVTDCCEGVEALNVTQTGGEVAITCRDDGLNANGGAADVENTWIKISGGSLSVVNTTGKDADGIDSNGDIVIEGGIIRISLPGTGGNCALDCGSENGGVLTVSGGSVVACGSSSMVEGFHENCAQTAVLWKLDSVSAEGETFALTDAAGNVLLSFEPECACSAVSFSCPELTVGQTYTAAVGEQSIEFTAEQTSVTLD